MRSDPIRVGTLSALCAIAFAIAGCGGEQPASAPTVIPAVTVARVVIEDYRPTATFTGRVEAIHKVELRARIDGFLEKRLFDEGADVKEGDLLFVIEKGLYQAAVDEAKAQVMKAEATLKLAEIEVKRQTELVQQAAAPQARLDETIAPARRGPGRAAGRQGAPGEGPASTRATPTSRRRSPAGSAGRMYQSAISSTPATGSLATIVSQDPIYVSFPVTQRELLDCARRQATTAATIRCLLQLADGSRYDNAGKVDYLGVTVNHGTDTVQARAVFPNPDRILIDGALVTWWLKSAKATRRCWSRSRLCKLDQSGVFVLVVDKDNKVEVRRVEVGRSPRRAYRGHEGAERGRARHHRGHPEGAARVRWCSRPKSSRWDEGCFRAFSSPARGWQSSSRSSSRSPALLR